MFATRILALVAAGAAIVPTAIVSAEPVSIATVADNAAVLTRRATIQTDDLDLGSAAGKRALQARVAHAVNEVCTLSDVPDNFENARCRQVASNDARQQVANALSHNTPRFAEAKPVPALTTTASGS